MTTQSELLLENQLIADLQQLEYEYVTIKDKDDLTANLKRQLEKHNKETSNKCLCHNAYASLQSINLKFARENGSLNQLA